MSWQDLVLAAGGFVIAAGIVPTFLGRVKPAVSTTATFVVVLGVSMFAFATLGLWLTAIGVAVQFVLWGVVLWQTLAARGADREVLVHVVDTMPALGFEEFAEEPPVEGAPAN